MSDWRTELGIGHAGHAFFATQADLNAAAPSSAHVHVSRRAFELLDLDGVLCSGAAPQGERDRYAAHEEVPSSALGTTPLVYFKEVKRIEPEAVVRLHRKFWNQGGAPVLVLVAPDAIHVYSGLVQPVARPGAGGRIDSLVQTLDRAATEVRQFLPAVASGEFFQRHAQSFNPRKRVDRVLLDNLQATREKLMAKSQGNIEPDALDALLCRLVFCCYLFDREVVGHVYLEDLGLQGHRHLRDVLSLTPRTAAKKGLYDLFRQLGRDFNGDLFSDDLDAEAARVHASCLDVLDDFFRATDVETGQRSFWPYDFSAIPIEAISAIYERFLKSDERGKGAFYTPRFLADVVLDVALATTPSLLGKRYLDPACGSGIFLVGLFNRIAEEWRRTHPGARNDRRARELRKILCSDLQGIDINPTACRITAFSLYLAYLDQLSPRDIQDLHERGHKLPKLIHYAPGGSGGEIEGSIWCGDFFAAGVDYPDADLVIGNPPWGSTAAEHTPAADWCAGRDQPTPVADRQMAAAFIWKSADHLTANGRACLVLPHGILFNHSTTALEFQRTLLQRHAVEHVLNLADYQRFLFEESEHPAVVVAYRKTPPADTRQSIEYWAPKTDWLVTRAEVIAVMPEDRSRLRLAQVLEDLKGEDAPQIWKRRYWATPRDWRLLDRLSLYPRLRDRVRRAREAPTPTKPWLIAVGFQPLTRGDDPARAETIALPSRLFISATSASLDLFLLQDDCTELAEARMPMRAGSNKSTAVFRAPHVLVAKGFTSTAFADFDVSFQDAVRGVSGPNEDRSLLVFLAAYLRSPLAQYFVFHTSSNWGVSRQEVHVEELLRLPFPLPDTMPDPGRARQLVAQVNRIVSDASARAADPFADRAALVRTASAAIEPLIDEYFDVLPGERVLLDDTLRVMIPSTRPTRRRSAVPTIQPSTGSQRDDYTKRLCATLNSWARQDRFVVRGCARASSELGIGVAILRKSEAGDAQAGSVEVQTADDGSKLVAVLDRLRRIASPKLNLIELIRGVKVFDGDCLYVVKPIARRLWTETAALNDADEIAGTILMHAPQGVA